MKIIYTLGIFNLVKDDTKEDRFQYRVESNGVTLSVSTHDACFDYINALHRTHKISQHVEKLRNI